MNTPVFKKKLLPQLIALIVSTTAFNIVYAADETPEAAPGSQVVEVRGIRDTLKKKSGWQTRFAKHR